MEGWEQEFRSCRLCEYRCGADRTAGERGVCNTGMPVVASRTLHPAPPESYTVFLRGCNFTCLNCQNWTIAHDSPEGLREGEPLPPAFLAEESIRRLESGAARRMGADRIFFSGGEPTIHLPYIEEVVREARRLRPGCKVNFDTNGFLTEHSLDRVLRFADSITFDLKAYHHDTHRALTGAPVEPVLRNAEIVAKKAPERLWEFRIVVIPGINEEDMEPLIRFLARLSPDLPVLFLCFRPNFVLETHPGPSREEMEEYVERARSAGLRKAAWAGVPVLPGEPMVPDGKVSAAYTRRGARLAASYALRHGCTVHPRACSSCTLKGNCPLRRYVPSRVT